MLAKLAGESKNCKWIYRIRANPGMPRGGIVPPTPVLAPGSALGSRPRVALSSDQVPPIYSGPRPSGSACRVLRVLPRPDRLPGPREDRLPIIKDFRRHLEIRRQGLPLVRSERRHPLDTKSSIDCSSTFSRAGPGRPCRRSRPASDRRTWAGRRSRRVQTSGSAPSPRSLLCPSDHHHPVPLHSPLIVVGTPGHGLSLVRHLFNLGRSGTNSFGVRVLGGIGPEPIQGATPDRA